MPVSEVSLNELSRRVGLAKSNVLRYFDSREAVLLDAESRAWAQNLLVVAGEPSPGPIAERVDAVARAIASTLAARPVLCDLMHAESGVLERNVSVETVLRHKRSTQQLAVELTQILRAAVPELTSRDAEDVIVMLILVAAAAWPYAQPSEALATAFAQDASVAAMHRDFASIVERSMALTTRGLLAEGTY